MEANPGTVEHAPLREYRQAGVNRLSLGVQSFDDAALKVLGRIHGASEALAACNNALEAGFDGVNVDLMYGLPGQTLSQAQADLEQALALAPQHLSYYQLTLEPNTVFHRYPPEHLPDDDTIFAMAEAGRALLAAAGFRQYEVSAFARDGHACRHNLNYWTFGDYLGVGAGAHGKISSGADGSIVRLIKQRHPRTYLTDQQRIIASQTLARDDLVFEFVLNALRLPAGFRLSTFAARTGLDSDALNPPLAEGIRLGWLVRDDERVTTTPLGFRFLNDVIGLFLPEEPAP